MYTFSDEHFPRLNEVGHEQYQYHSRKIKPEHDRAQRIFSAAGASNQSVFSSDWPRFKFEQRCLYQVVESDSSGELC